MKRSAIIIFALWITTLSVGASERPWTGADDLPTAPLSCGAALAQTTVRVYDGGVPANAPARKGKKLDVVDVPKLIGIGYFNATSKGIAAAAKEIGTVTVRTDGPTKANIDEQITTIDNYITRGVDGILFAANDPVAIAPVLKRALSKGINVVGYDADAARNARQWFVNQTEFNSMAKALLDTLAREMGARGSFAIVTSTFTTPNQARWIAEMSAYQAKCYPQMQWLETVEAQEDNMLSFTQTATLINKYGDRLSGVVGMTTVATPAAAEAISQARKCGKVVVTGMATPNAIKPYLNNGCMKSAVLWSPVDLGYAGMYALRAVADGSLKPGSTSLQAGRLGELKVVNGSEILLGSPYLFTKSNVNGFDF